MNTLIPCTPLAVVELIKRTGKQLNTYEINQIVAIFFIPIGIQTKGKNAVICGRSKNVGMPIAMLLHSDASGKKCNTSYGTKKIIFKII